MQDAAVCMVTGISAEYILLHRRQQIALCAIRDSSRVCNHIIIQKTIARKGLRFSRFLQLQQLQLRLKRIRIEAARRFLDIHIIPRTERSHRRCIVKAVLTSAVCDKWIKRNIGTHTGFQNSLRRKCCQPLRIDGIGADAIADRQAVNAAAPSQSLTDAGVHRIQRRGAVRVHPRQQILKHVRVAQLLPLRFAQQIDIIALACAKLGQRQFLFLGGLRFNHRDPVSRI